MAKRIALALAGSLVVASFGAQAQADAETQRRMEWQAQQVRALQAEQAQAQVKVDAMEREQQALQPLLKALLLAETDAERQALLQQVAAINPALADEYRVALNMAPASP